MPAYNSTPFIGRESELAEIAGLLATPGCRLLTLVGPGGIGKTRLAMEAVGMLAGAGLRPAPTDVHFVPLQALTSPDFIVPAIADALNFQFHSGGNPKQQLLGFLADTTKILIFDNMEHLLDGAGLLPDILAAAPKVRLLVTSRERINMVEEWVLEIGGLAYPQNEIQADIENFSAVALFAQRARQANARFRLTGSNLAAVVRICRLVGGMPLGIELAASRVHVLTCEAIADEIGHSLNILETAAQNIEPRHRTMRAAIAPTWERLSGDEKNAFQKMSVFRGGFTRQAALVVAGATLEMLTALVDKSLLRLEPDGRYDIHELLRQYGEEQLEKSGEMDAARDAHSACFAEFLHQRVDDLKGRRQMAAMAEVSDDFMNARTAWTWAAGRRHEDAVEQMIEGLWVFCDISSRLREAWSLFHYAAQAFATERRSDRLWGRLLARAANEAGYHVQAETALEIARRHDDLAEIAFCLERLGSNAYDQRDFASAKGMLEQSVAIYRQIGERFFLAHVLFELMSENSHQNWDDFKRYGDESLRLRREIGDVVGTAWSLAAVAIGEARAGNFTKSEGLWLERIALGHQTGNRNLVALGHAHLSHHVYFFQGEFGKARAAAEEALRITAALHHSNATAWSLVTLGLLACMDEDYLAGKKLCQEGASIRSLASTADLAAWGLSIAECGLENYDAARQCLAKSLKHMRGNRGMIGVLSCLSVAAIILAHDGQEIRAAELLGLAFRHQARWMEHWPLLGRLRADLEQALGSDAYLAAWERGTLLDAEAAFESQFHAADIQPSEAIHPDNRLTSRELEILRLLADGLSNKEIAGRLFLSAGTVKWYLSEIYNKLGVHNRTQAVTRGRALKLLR